jgi:hypothetical protein
MAHKTVIPGAQYVQDEMGRIVGRRNPVPSALAIHNGGPGAKRGIEVPLFSGMGNDVYKSVRNYINYRTKLESPEWKAGKLEHARKKAEAEVAAARTRVELAK